MFRCNIPQAVLGSNTSSKRGNNSNLVQLAKTRTQILHTCKLHVTSSKKMNRSAPFLLTFHGRTPCSRFPPQLFDTGLKRTKQRTTASMNKSNEQLTSQSHCIYVVITMTEDVHASNFVTHKHETPSKFDITGTSTLQDTANTQNAPLKRANIEQTNNS